MGRTRGFIIEWPVRTAVEDGRTFVVEQTHDGSCHACVDGTDVWRSMGTPERQPSIGTVVGRFIYCWHATTREVVILAPRRR
jgi:hypothetical protein